MAGTSGQALLHPCVHAPWASLWQLLCCCLVGSSCSGPIHPPLSRSPLTTPSIFFCSCRDCCLRMWDLVKGRCTYTSKLEGEAEAVAFCAEDGGERYALLCGASVTLHDVQGGAGAAGSAHGTCRRCSCFWLGQQRRRRGVRLLANLSPACHAAAPLQVCCAR